MIYLIKGWSQDQRRFIETAYTKQQVWQFLKAEIKWRKEVRQWLRAEGVSGHVLKLRRKGQPEAPFYINRKARRAFLRNVRRAA